MDLFYEAISLYRRRHYDLCIEKCNALLHKNAAQQGPWELKMRAMTQRVYIDDIEADDGIAESDDDEFNTNRLATAPRPGTTLRTATAHDYKLEKKYGGGGGRPRTSTGKPLTGMARPGTLPQRPGSSLKTRAGTTGRPNSTARNIRLGSASMFALGDPTSDLFQASKLNPQKFANQDSVAKLLFQFLYYHEGDIRKALDLCTAVGQYNLKINNLKHTSKWWWNTQCGRCLLTLGKPRDAEQYLKQSLTQFAHPDTALLLARVYFKIDQPLAALEVLDVALKILPDDIGLLTQQGRIFELMDNLKASVRMYRHIAQLEPVNAEALASIAVHNFYSNQPELALMYYRRILSMGVHTCELYCNLGLCCLYGGQLDLVLPCFQRALRLSTSSEQRADVWYNLSFTAMTTGDLNLARRCLRLCISSDGSHGAALNNLAILSIGCGQTKKARSYLIAAKNVLPNNEEIVFNHKLMDKMH